MLCIVPANTIWHLLVVIKKPFNCPHTTFLTSYKSHILNLSQSKFQQYIIYQENYKFKFTNSNTNFVNFWVGYQKLLLYTTTSCLLWLSLFQFIILFKCNPSISNPGPNSSRQFKTSTDFSIFYQNVQGPLVILRKITLNWIIIKFLN